METIEVHKATLKADRKDTKEMWRVLMAMYSNVSPELKQSAIDYIMVYKEHYEKNLKMINRVLNKLNSQP